MGVALERGLTREAVVELAGRGGGPEWLRRQRLEAWDTFDSVPWPDASQEEWRRVDLTGLNLDEYRPFAAASPEFRRGADALPGWLRPAPASMAGGLAIQHNSEAAFSAVQEELARQGVLIMGLEQAAQERPDLVRGFFGRAVPAATGKLEALNGALWSGGTLVYVPRNVAAELPLHLIVSADAPGLALFPRLLLVAEQGSSVTVIEEHASAALEGETFVSPVAEVLVGDGAHVRYITVQRWGPRVRELGTRRIVVGRDARLDWVTVVLGGRQSKMRLQASFEGEGSESNLRGLYFGSASQEMHLDTLQDHGAAHTASDLYFKGALRDAARAVYYGVIRVRPEAQQTNGYQQNRNLLLSDQAKADSIPILEIEANDVRCSHGATVGQVDPEQVFYLMSRGLPRLESERLLVRAFFQEVLDTIPQEDVRQRVTDAVSDKVSMG